MMETEQAEPQEVIDPEDPAFVPIEQHQVLRDRVAELETELAGLARGDDKDALLFAALAEAQGEYDEVKRTAEVKVKTKAGYTYTFKYAPLENLFDACGPALSKHGLAFVQPLDKDGNGGMVLKNRLTHKAGGLLEFTIPLPLPKEGLTGESIKNFGSTITYLRRYCAAPMLGVASEEDDDAGQASGDETIPLPTGEQRRTIREILKEAEKHKVSLGEAARAASPTTRDEADALIKQLREALQKGLQEQKGDAKTNGSKATAKRGTPSKVK